MKISVAELEIDLWLSKIVGVHELISSFVTQAGKTRGDPTQGKSLKRLSFFPRRWRK
jgi:hypothetical protein